MMRKPAESRTCRCFWLRLSVRVSEWPNIMLRVDVSPAEEPFMRTIGLVAAALAALPLTSIRRARRRGVGRPRHTRRYELRLSLLCAMPGKHSWDWRILRSQPGFSHL